MRTDCKNVATALAMTLWHVVLRPNVDCQTLDNRWEMYHIY